MMDAGVNWAIQAFDSLDPENALTPAHRLQLSFQYDIQQWVVAAVSELMDPGRQVGRKLVRLISDDDMEQIVKVETTMKDRAASAIWDLYKKDIR
jgi:hypothetical protein